MNGVLHPGLDWSELWIYAGTWQLQWETENHCEWNYQYSRSVSPGDVEPHFKLYIILTLVPLFSSCDVLGTIYFFSPAFYTYSPYFSGNKSCACAHHKNVWEWSISIYASRFTHSRNSPWSALDRRIGCLQSQSGCSVEETNCCPRQNWTTIAWFCCL